MKQRMCNVKDVVAMVARSLIEEAEADLISKIYYTSFKYEFLFPRVFTTAYHFNF